MKAMQYFFSKFAHCTCEARKSFLLILAVSAGMKIVMLLQADIINLDGIRYINSAYELFSGNPLAAFQHEKMLGYTFFLGLMHLAISDWYMAGKMLSMVALVLTTIPLYLLVRDLFGDRAALLTCLVFSILPFVNELVTMVVKDPLFLLCVVTAVWLVSKGLQNRPWRYLPVAGFFSFLSMLFRVEGVVFILTVLIAFLFFLFVRGADRRVQLQSLAAFCVFPALVVLGAVVVVASGIVPEAIMLLLREKFGYYFTFDLMANYQSIYQYLKAAEPQFNGGQWTNDFFEFARYQISLIYLIGLLLVFSKALFPSMLIPLGYGLVLKGYWCRQLILLLIIILSFLGMDFLFLLKNNFISERYMMIPVILSLVLVGYGLDRLLRRLEHFRYKSIVYPLIIILCVIAPATKSFSSLADEKMVLRTSGEWLESHYDLNRVQLITNDERIAYYAGLMRGLYRVFPPTGKTNIEMMALRKGCDLIILESSKKAGKGPVLSKFELVKEFAGKKKMIKVYERIK
jgi:hypothetical protein